MDKPKHEAEPYFSQPVRQIVMMLVVVALVGTGGYLAYSRIFPIFVSSPWLNGVILTVFFLGVVSCFWQVVQLTRSVTWIEDFAAHRPGHELTKAPLLLAPLAALLRARGARTQIAYSSARSILESVATRIEEARDITRYTSSLLVFLGLLGTFYGLATTVPAVVETIRALAPEEGESGIAVFEKLMTGLEAQLGGMGTAFSSSLLGLAGSLVVGLLELFVSHGQNRFYRELEEWLSSITRLSFAAADGDGGGDSSGVAVVLDHMAEQMEALQRIYTESDISRSLVDEQLSLMSNSIEKLLHRLDQDAGSTEILVRIADGQERMIAALAGREPAGGEEMDAESRMRLRSIDVQLLRLLEEVAAGRQESVADLRGDIAELTRAVRALAWQSGGQRSS
ncbi:biopolymer transporter ExbB [Ostreiculturibacter nitratireducens]|uniref:biopolymer transporter ExbB n=1 Tax=Ostreiculturibacter nitratireducens TaxID=3075226 RepID=UPI0031B63C88